MKKCISILLALLLALSLTACATKAPSSGVDSSGTAASSELETSKPENEDDFSDPRKLTLSYAVMDDLTCPCESMMREVNRYLYDCGTEYRVEFLPLPKVKYREELKKAMAAGKPVDLFYTGDSYMETVSWTAPLITYDDYLIDGVEAYDLTDYLESAEGTALKEALHPLAWEELKRDGGIYGVYEDAFVSTPMVYYVNKQLMTKYSITEEDLKVPFEQLGPILEKVKAGEGGDFFPMQVEDAQTILYNSNFYFPFLSSAFSASPEDMKAMYLFDLPEVKTIIQAMSGYAQNGLLEDCTFHALELDHCFLIPGSIESSVSQESGWYYFSDGSSAREGKDYIVITPDERVVANGKRDDAVCIYAGSEHIEQSLDLLSCIYTDSALSDLLIHGVEGEQYILDADGKILPIYGNGQTDTPENYQWNRRHYYGNRYLATRMADDREDYRERTWALYDNAQIGPFLGIRVHLEEPDPRAEEMSSFMAEFAHQLTLPENGGKYQELIEDTRRQLDELGGQELLQETQRQIDEQTGGNGQ